MRKYFAENIDLYTHTFLCEVPGGDRVKVKLDDRFMHISIVISSEAEVWRVDVDDQAELLLNKGVAVKKSSGDVKEYHHVENVTYEGKTKRKTVSPVLNDKNILESIFNTTLWTFEEEVRTRNVYKSAEMPTGAPTL